MDEKNLSNSIDQTATDTTGQSTHDALTQLAHETMAAIEAAEAGVAARTTETTQPLPEWLVGGPDWLLPVIERIARALPLYRPDSYGLSAHQAAEFMAAMAEFSAEPAPVAVRRESVATHASEALPEWLQGGPNWLLPIVERIARALPLHRPDDPFRIDARTAAESLAEMAEFSAGYVNAEAAAAKQQGRVAAATRHLHTNLTDLIHAELSQIDRVAQASAFHREFVGSLERQYGDAGNLIWGLAVDRLEVSEPAVAEFALAAAEA